MKKLIIGSFLIFICNPLISQKKPLDHSVYDGWQSIGERMISKNGQWVVYTICPQEGDTTLVIQQADGKYKKEIERGSNAAITEDSRFVIFKIKPYQKELREARIKNKKREDFPKDSLGIVELGKEEINKIPKVRTFKVPDNSSGWVAYWMEKPKDASAAEDGADLNLKNLNSGTDKTFNSVSEYYFDKKGTKLLLETSKSAKDSFGKAYVLLVHLSSGKTDTLARGGNDFRGFAFDEHGSQLAFVAERDAEPKALQKFYKLWYYRDGMDSAAEIVEKSSVGMKLGMTVSEHGNLSFSKSGKRLFFGSSMIQPPKDTTLIEADLVKLDIWHYNDDYLQTQQLVQLNSELRRNYLTVYDITKKSIEQLGSEEIPQVIQTNDGDGDLFVGITDVGKRKESQWLGQTRKDIYVINVADGSKKMIKQNLQGQTYPSTTGKYVLWYDRPAKNYFIWDGNTVKNITSKITVPLWNEEFDSPDNPNQYGFMGWHEDDAAIYVYDKYDIWKVDVTGKKSPFNITSGIGRKNATTYRYVQLDNEKKSFKNEAILTRVFNNKTKEANLAIVNTNGQVTDVKMGDKKISFGQIIAANKNLNGSWLYEKENFTNPPDLYITKSFPDGSMANEKTIVATEIKLTSINPQQKVYNWGTAELYKWTTFSGKTSEGILFKPEDFDPNKKYPVVIYFYEKLSNNLHNYIEPAPTRSAINTSFFVSNGYIVFHPNISYGTGHPGKDAYEYIVSGAKSLIAKYKWIDANNIGLEGHSWGGYQGAYIITKTNMFKAVWAGAPVVNMTSAYGGIRYGTGVSRQFQYEHTQTRIGKTLWDGLPFYLESSPLFSLNKVTTPVVILHNDNDDAVPFTQGIEMFTALKRLGKKVWLINYNGEPHGVVQRKNRKDLAIRFEQFFGHFLKGEKPAKWLSEGVPAIKKGKDWGLEIE